MKLRIQNIQMMPDGFLLSYVDTDDDLRKVGTSLTHNLFVPEELTDVADLADELEAVAAKMLERALALHGASAPETEDEVIRKMNADAGPLGDLMDALSGTAPPDEDSSDDELEVGPYDNPDERPLAAPALDAGGRKAGPLPDRE